MEVELRRLVQELARAGDAGDEGEQEAAAHQIASDLQGVRSLAVKRSDVRTLTDLALETPNSGVRAACVEALATLVPLVQKGQKVLEQDVLDVCFRFADDVSAGSTCLDLLAGLLGSDQDQTGHLIAPAVTRGAIDLLLRATQQSSSEQGDLGRTGDNMLGALAALALQPAYALELHEKGLWAFLMGLYERTQTVTTNFFLLTSRAAKELSAPQFRFCRASAAKRFVAESGDDVDETISSAYFIDYVPSRGYSAQSGLLDESKLGADEMDLASEVCFQISSSGLLRLVNSVAHRIDHDVLSEICLQTLGSLAPVMHKVVAQRKRIHMARGVVKVIPSLRDRRLRIVVYILESMLGVPANQDIVCQCGAVEALAEKGLRLLQRHDPEARDLCATFVDFMLQVSMLPDGPAELCSTRSICFLQGAMADIAQVQIKQRPRSSMSTRSTGSFASTATSWASTMEICALLTLINVALQSPVMASVTEANLHQALIAASARLDELGLLAVLGSAFFLGRSTAAYSSRELPRLQPEHVQLLNKLFEATANGEPTLGDAQWSLFELLEALQYLALAPHNGSEMQPVLPGVLATLRRVLRDENEADVELVGLLVKVLLTMSYHKEVMGDLVAKRGAVEKLLLQARKILPSFADAQRDVETLLTSIDSEEVAQERSPYHFGASSIAQGFVKRVSRSLARSSLSRARPGTKTAKSAS